MFVNYRATGRAAANSSATSSTTASSSSASHINMVSDILWMVMSFLVILYTIRVYKQLSFFKAGRMIPS